LGIVFFANTKAIDRAQKNLQEINELTHKSDVYRDLIRESVLKDLNATDNNLGLFNQIHQASIIEAKLNGKTLDVNREDRTSKNFIRKFIEFKDFMIMWDFPFQILEDVENATLVDFSVYWDSIAGIKNFYYPVIEDKRFTLYVYEHEKKEDRKPPNYKPNEYQIVVDISQSANEIPLDAIFHPKKFKLRPVEINEDTPAELKLLIEEKGMSHYFRYRVNYVRQFDSGGNPYSVRLRPIIFYPKEVVEFNWSPQERIIQYTETDWKPGEFKETFPELNSLTENLQSLKLSEVGKLLERDKKRAAESFEIFGAKIPSEIIGIWGVIILLCIQLYFTLHMRDFLEKVNKSKETVNYPWIALYSGFLPKVITVISVSLLPLFVIGIVRYYEFDYVNFKWITQSDKFWDWGFVILPCLVSAILGAATMYYFYRLWRFRVTTN